MPMLCSTFSALSISAFSASSRACAAVSCSLSTDLTELSSARSFSISSLSLAACCAAACFRAPFGARVSSERAGADVPAHESGVTTTYVQYWIQPNHHMSDSVQLGAL